MHRTATTRAAGRHVAVLAVALFAAAALSWGRAALAGTMRVDQAPIPMAATVALLIGLALAFAAAARSYLAAHRALQEPPISMAGASIESISLRRLLYWAIALHGIAALALPLTSNDAFSNLAYGRLVNAGLNPYLHGPGALAAGDPFRAYVGQRWIDTPSVYGPMLVGVSAISSYVGRVDIGLLVYKAIALLLSLASVALAYRFCRDHVAREEAPAAFFLFAAAPIALWDLSGQAHNDVLLVLALTGFVLAARAERSWAAFGCLVVGVYAKVAAIALLGLYLWRELRRAPLRAVAMGGLVLVAGVLLYAPFWSGAETLRSLAEASGADAGANRASNTITSLLVAACIPLGEVAQTWAYRVGWGAGMILMIVLGLRALIRTRTVDDIIHQGLIVLLAYDLVGAAWFQPWYATWLLPLAMAERDARLRRIIAVYVGLLPLCYVLRPLEPLIPLAINITVAVMLWRLRRPAPPTPAA